MAITYYYDPTTKQYNNIDSSTYDMGVSQGWMPSNLQKITEKEYKDRRISSGLSDVNGMPNQVIINHAATTLNPEWSKSQSEIKRLDNLIQNYSGKINVLKDQLNVDYGFNDPNKRQGILNSIKELEVELNDAKSKQEIYSKTSQYIADPYTGNMTDQGTIKNKLKEISVNPDWTNLQGTISNIKTKITPLEKLIEDAQNHIGAIKENNPYTWQANNSLAGDVGMEERRIKEYQDQIQRYNDQINSYNNDVTTGKVTQYLDGDGQPILDKAAYDKAADATALINQPSMNTDYFGAMTPEEWQAKIYNQLMPTYAEQVKNKTGPDVMKAFSETLDKPYNSGLKTIMENAASRGTSTAGLTGNQLAEALAQKNLAIQNKQENIGSDLQTFLDSLAQSGYNTSVQNVSQNIMDAFKKSGQSWDNYYRTNQSSINNQINEKAAQTGIDYETLQTQNKYNDQDYLDSINAISQLWGTAGQLGGTSAYNFNNKNTNTSSTTSSVPITQAVMNNSNLYNNANTAVSTNPKTGENYSAGLYDSSKKWLGY